MRQYVLIIDKLSWRSVKEPTKLHLGTDPILDHMLNLALFKKDIIPKNVDVSENEGV